MKTCVFIIGTNASGKSTLARELIHRFGGVKKYDEGLTFCSDEKTAFAGKYANVVYGGVDYFNSTKKLADIVKKGFETQDVIICEGSYMNTFGNNLTNTMFVAQKHLVVFLYASSKELDKRLKQRSGKGLSDRVLPKQKTAAAAMKKWASVGVPFVCIDTENCGIEETAKIVFEKIQNLSSGDNNNSIAKGGSNDV